MTDVLVVGGGPAGLAAALAAARRGFETHLVEATPRLGGMAASFSVAGMRVDLGSHRLHPVAPPRIRALLDELLGDDLQVRQRRGRLRLGDRWIGFPFRPLDLARSPPPSFGAAAVRDLATGPFRSARDGSYAEVVRAGLGPAALDWFHGPMATKLWGVDPRQLSGHLAHKRIPVRSPRGLARKLVATSRASGRTFLYPRDGYGQIVERLADAAAEAGARIETDRSVERIEPAPRPGAGPTVTLSGDAPTRIAHVIWTGQPSALDRCLPSPTGSGWPSIPHRGLVLAYLVAEGRRWTPFDAHYVPQPEVAFSRISEPRNYRDADDPADRTVLCAELPCDPGDQLWMADTDEIGRLTLDGIERLGLPRPLVDHVEVRRLPSVYPVVRVGEDAQRTRWLERTGSLDGITIVGRQGRLVADNLHHVLDMALSAVDCLTGSGRRDEARWAEATRRFETFVVED